MSDLLIVALAEAVIIIVLLVGLLSREWDHDNAIKWMVKTEAEERDKLLQRIQHPEREPIVLPQHPDVSARSQEEVEEAEKREAEHRRNLQMIGTVAGPE